MSRALRLPAAVRRAIVDHARHEAPNECCGFLLGAGATVAFSWPAANVSSTPRSRFKVDPREHISLRRIVRRLRPEVGIIGIYHSHPRGPGRPSESDLRLAHVSEWAYVLVDLSVSPRPKVTAWAIQNGRARPWRLTR